MIPGLKSLAKDLEELKEQLPRTPSPEDLELQAYLRSLTPEEIRRAGEIFIRMDQGREPTAADIDFILELDARPPITLPQIDPSQPACFCCGGQPASARGHPPSQPVCEPCFKHMCGRSYDHGL